jgi:hypothetical protein
MPEIKLGSSENMKNINIGSKELQAIKKGSVVVWLNNLAPEIVLTTPPVGEFGDSNFPINVVGTTTTTITFKARDLDPGDKVASYSVTGPPGFTPVPTTPISPPTNPATGLSFTIPSTLFTIIGVPTADNVFTITVADQKGRDDDYTVTVENVTVEGPTARVQTPFPNLPDAYNGFDFTRSATFSITQSPSAINAFYTPEYSDDGGTTWKTYGGPVVLYATATCSNPASRGISSRSVFSGLPTANGTSASSYLTVPTPSPFQKRYNSDTGINQPLVWRPNTILQYRKNCSGETQSFRIYSQGGATIPYSSAVNTRNFFNHNPSATVSMDFPVFGRITKSVRFSSTTATGDFSQYYYPYNYPDGLPTPYLSSIDFSGVSYGTVSLAASYGPTQITAGEPVSLTMTAIVNGTISSYGSMGGYMGYWNGSSPTQSQSGQSITLTWDTTNWSPGTSSQGIASFVRFQSNGSGYNMVLGYPGNYTVTVIDPNPPPPADDINNPA